MSDPKKEILFLSETKWHDGRGYECSLLTYKNGEMDYHRQTGERFDDDVKKAQEILKARGLYMPRMKWEFIGPSGAYITVKKIEAK